MLHCVTLRIWGMWDRNSPGQMANLSKQYAGMLGSGYSFNKWSQAFPSTKKTSRRKAIPFEDI